MNDARRHDRNGLILIVGCLVLLGLGIAFAGLMQALEPKRDPVTLCPEGKAVAGHFVVLFDRTDPMSDLQRQRALDELHSIERSRLRPGELLSVWAIGDYEEGTVRCLFSRCYPGREAHALWENPAFIGAACDSLFTKPLDSALASLPREERASRSPIMSAIREISEQPEFTEVHGPREIVLISDLMENTAAFSLYRNRPDFQLVRTLRAHDKTRADLRGVIVNVLYVGRRDNQVSTADLLEFWQAYFADCHAAAVRFHRL